MSHISVLLTRITIPFATIVLIASLHLSTGRAGSLALTNEFIIRGALLVVRETRLVPEMLITFGARDSDGGESARSPSHTIATPLVANVCHQLRTNCYTL